LGAEATAVMTCDHFSYFDPDLDPDSEEAVNLALAKVWSCMNALKS